MKKKLISSLSACTFLLATSAFMTQSSNGIQGYAGSPGEGTCSSCHGGGASSSSAITINSTPTFSFNENAEMTFTPDSIYKIDVEVTAVGFSKFGFASQILSSSSINSGTLQAAGSGVKFLNSGSKRTAVHSTVKNAAVNTVTFSYQWKAPRDGDATIYAIANAVNGNGNTGGDFVVSPVSVPLVAEVVPVPHDTSTVGLKTISELVFSGIVAYPNPCKDVCSLNYNLLRHSEVRIQLLNSEGKLLKSLFAENETPGLHSHSFYFSDLTEGSYFLKISSEKTTFSKKIQLFR